MTVATRYTVSQIDPMTFAIWRMGLAFVCLLPVALLVHGRRFSWRDLIPMGVLGGGFIALFTLGVATALTYTTASRGSVVLALVPILTVLLAAAVRREPLTGSKLLGGFLSFGGVGVVVADSALLDLAGDRLRGDGIMLVMAASIAVFNVFSRPFLQRYNPVRVSTYFMGAGWLAMMIVAGCQGTPFLQPALNLPGWLSLVYTGTVAGAVPALLFHWALGRLEAGRVTVTLGLNAVSATVLGVLLLDESLTGWFGVGFLLVLAGIWLSSRGSSRLKFG